MIRLARDGVFPITVGADGRRLPTATGYDYAGTIQGEGKLAGVPSLFVRTQGCNLRCVWADSRGGYCRCDTAYTSFAPGGYAIEADEVYRLLCLNASDNIHHVVLTGGEPMLQAGELAPLMERLRADGFHLTVETNGTIFSEPMVRMASLLSISPKLPSSYPTADKLAALGLEPTSATERHPMVASNALALAQTLTLASECGTDVQLKFVVSSPDDEQAIDALLSELPAVSPNDILLMPQGVTQSDMMNNGLAATAIAVRRGWRFAPRLHILLWGDKEGV